MSQPANPPIDLDTAYCMVRLAPHPDARLVGMFVMPRLGRVHYINAEPALSARFIVERWAEMHRAIGVVGWDGTGAPCYDHAGHDDDGGGEPATGLGAAAGRRADGGRRA